MDEEKQTDSAIRVTAMLGVLNDKAEKQKKKIAKILSLPKSQRNITHLKTVLHEARSIRKLLKKVKKECLNVVCPMCSTQFKVDVPQDQ